jgi:hypothetical protein
MSNLQMSLKTKWFEMTKSGIKTEDYRELTPYWYKRLCFKPTMGCVSDYPENLQAGNGYIFKKFKVNIMTLGYPKSTDSERIIKFEHKGIEIRTGNTAWGAEEGKLYFVIKHGSSFNAY